MTYQQTIAKIESDTARILEAGRALREECARFERSLSPMDLAILEVQPKEKP